jgi:hypothetical protein
MPPTTPPIILLDELLRPELPPEELLPLNVVALVVTANTVLVVRVPVDVTPSLVVTNVVVMARVALEVEKEMVSVAMALVISEVAVTDPAELVWEAVEVVNSTEVEGGDVSVLVESTCAVV